jgi:cell division protease FtsH
MPSSGPPPPPPPPRRPQGGADGGQNKPRFEDGWPKWLIWVVVGAVVLVLSVYSLSSTSDAKKISYSTFMSSVDGGKVKTVTYNNDTGHIAGKYDDGTKFTTTGLIPFPEHDLSVLRAEKVQLTPNTPQTNWLESILPFILMVGLFSLFFMWMMRRSSGQMGGIMSVGRSKAKTYSADSPRTTFADVAVYDGVKTEVREVVEFLKFP